MCPSPAFRTVPSAPQSLREAWIALTGLAAVFLFEMLDNSILTIALPTIGRDLDASTTGLQWVTGAYGVVFGGLMLVFGTIADRFGRRRVMLVGLTLLGLSSLATAGVDSTGELIGVRVAMGVAAAMTTPGSMALAFRLFDSDTLRMRAITLISTVGLVGLAIGPAVGGFALAIAPWQAPLLINVPIAVLAFIGIRAGIPNDDPTTLHREPIDVAGAALGTVAIACALLAPTLFVDNGFRSTFASACAAAAVVAAIAFVVWERTAPHPLLDLALIARPLVSSGLLYKAATGIAMAGVGYLVGLQMQLDWGWSAGFAALGMLPQVVVLIAGSVFVEPFIRWVGYTRAAWISSLTVVAGMLVYALLGTRGYPWVALALVLVAAGMRVVGVVAGLNVLRGLPESRSSVGAALTDTATEVSSGVGVAIAGTILAGLFTGSVAAGTWSAHQHAEFHSVVIVSGLTLTTIAVLLVGWGMRRAVHHSRSDDPPMAETDPAPAPR